jgi:flagellar hook-length control protein FliK
VRQQPAVEKTLADKAPAIRAMEAAPAAALAPAAQAQLAGKAAEAAASNQLPARVGTSAWDQQLGQKVVWMVAGGEQSAALTLNPPDLGPLQVVLNVSNDQASASFTAAQPEVRQALEAAMPKLREMMSEAGIQLGSATVSADTSGQQQAFDQARSAQQGNGGGSRGGRGLGGGDDGNAMNGGTNATPAPRRSVLGAVDTFA